MNLDIQALIKKAVDEAIKNLREILKNDRKNNETLIKKAIKEAVEAGRTEGERKTKNIYKDTERRLYALPDLKEKVEKDKLYLQDFKEHGRGRHSTDIVRFQKAGVRLDEAEIEEAIIQDYAARIATDEHEIKVIEDALAPLTSDPYFRVIEGKYFEHITDDEIAKEIKCDPSTVRRNRGRMISKMSIRLFGSEAL